MTSNQLLEEFHKDDKGTEARYGGRVLEVTGMLWYYGNTSTDEPTLEFDALKGHYTTVQCVTADPEPWGRALLGQTVTVRGVFLGNASLPRLKDCDILAVTGPQPPTFTAEQLAKEYDADPFDFRKKYERKPIVYVGVLAGIRRKDDHMSGGTFTPGPDKKPLYGNFPWSKADRKVTDTLKVGQKIKVVAQFEFFGAPRLNDVKVLEVLP